MLQNLSEEIRECHDRAEKWARRAALADDPKLRTYYLERERCWLQLARSYELSQRLMLYNNEAARRTQERLTRDDLANQDGRNWRPLSLAPFGRDLQLAVIDYDGLHPLLFPCRRVLRGWIETDSNKPIAVRPTHWREWRAALVLF